MINQAPCRRRATFDAWPPAFRRCTWIQVRLGGGRDVIIENVEADLYAAIDRAVDRADRAVVRQVARTRQRSHTACRPSRKYEKIRILTTRNVAELTFRGSADD